MSICVTNKHMYVQFIDDDAGRTLAQANSLKDEKANIEVAKALGAKAAEAAKAAGISLVVVDRGGRKYTGRVAAIVEAEARVLASESSMNWTYMCLFVTQIDMRGFSAVPITR